MSPAAKPLTDVDRHRRLINRLLEAASPATLALAQILSGCTPTNPCGSGACPLCGRAFQLMAADLARKVIREPARAVRDRMSAITLVSETGCVVPDDLSVRVCFDVAAEAAAAFKAARIPPCMAALDISFNEDDTGDVEDHFCVHVHGVSRDWLADAQIDGLERALPPTDLVAKPVHVDLLDLRERGRLYPFKPEAVRRVSYIDTSNTGRRPFRNTHRRELRPWQSILLALTQHKLGYKRRLITHDIEPDAVNTALNAFYRARDSP